VRAQWKKLLGVAIAKEDKRLNLNDKNKIK